MFFIIPIILIYTLVYPPFILQKLVPDEYRLFIEFMILFYLCLRIIDFKSLKLPIVIIVAIFVFFLSVAFGNSELRSVLSSFNKIVFLIFLIKLIKENEQLFRSLKSFWVCLWVFFSLSAILIAFLYYLGVNYSGGPLDNYFYYSYPIIGNFTTKYVLGFNFVRVSGYIWEPGQLAFFFGLNIFGAKHLVQNVHMRLLFIILNFLGGVATFSFSFYILLSSVMIYKYLFYTNVKRTWLSVTVFALVVVAVGYVVLIRFGLSDVTSAEDRTARYDIATTLLMKNNIKTGLFGYGISYTVGDESENEDKIGIGSGVINLLIERGLIMLIFMLWLLHRYSGHDLILLIYILAYNMVQDFLWYPMFYLGLALFFGSYWYENRLFVECDTLVLASGCSNDQQLAKDNG